VAVRRAAGLWTVPLAVALAALWPLSAALVSPTAMPAALVAAGAFAATLARPAYGIAIALALAPFINTVVGGSPAKPVQLLVPALAFGVLVYGVLVRREPLSAERSRSLTVAVVAFGAAALLVSAQALEPAESVNKVVLIATAIAVYLGARQVCWERADFTVILGGALAGVLAASIQGIGLHFAGTFSEQGFVSGGEVIGRVQGSFGHPNLYAGYLAVLMPVAVAVVATRDFGGAVRWLAATALVLAVPAMYWSYARGALVGLIAGALIWFAVTRPRWAIATVIVLVVGAAALAPATLRERFDPETSGGDIALRSDIWNAAFEIYGEDPVLGVGVNNFSVAYEELPATAANASQRRLLHQDQLLVPPHPQSQYLQALSEGGLVGVAALAGLIVAALLAVARAARAVGPRTRALGAGLAIGLIGMLVHGLVEVPLTTETILPLFALLALCGVALDREALGREPV
jgi:O-antigen ligase